MPSLGKANEYTAHFIASHSMLPSSPQGSILGSFLFAVFGWLLGALGHDAGHFAISHKAWVNDAGVWAMSLLCNPMLWQHQHTYAHHSHTNDMAHDPDLHHFETLLRVHRRFPKQSIHGMQTNWLYVMFAYLFVVFGTCFWIPLNMIHDGKTLYNMLEWTDRTRPLRYFGFCLHVVVYVGVIMLLPYFVHTSWLSAWAAVTVHVSTTGLIFAIFSQINHLNAASFPEPTENGESEDASTASRQTRAKLLANSWAARQVETSNNFASNSVLWHFLSNGLNYQIEHHLFPGLNHCHLHHIAPVVKETCKEYGVVYKSYESWSDIMQATLQWLDCLAKEDDDAQHPAPKTAMKCE
jgi:fatty acid desaturase